MKKLFPNSFIVVLAAVNRKPGGYSISRLAEESPHNQAIISNRIMAMEEQGLIVREQIEKNVGKGAPGKMIWPTNAGADLYDALKKHKLIS